MTYEVGQRWRVTIPMSDISALMAIEKLLHRGEPKPADFEGEVIEWALEMTFVDCPAAGALLEVWSDGTVRDQNGNALTLTRETL